VRRKYGKEALRICLQGKVRADEGNPRMRSPWTETYSTNKTTATFAGGAIGMCRMLGIVPGEAGVVDLNVLKAFRNLAMSGCVLPKSRSGHTDGWGMVVWNNSLPEYIAREPNNAAIDPQYDVALDRMKNKPISSPLLAHLRKASSGSKRTRENTHPFLFKKWAFAHNGTIRRMNLRDRTDSQWFFHSVMERLDLSNGDVVQAIAEQVKSVREVYDYSSLTFLLSDGKSLYAYRDCSSNEDYYTLYYTQVDGAIIVCQERILDSRWEVVGNGQLLKVDAEKLQCEFLEVM